MALGPYEALIHVSLGFTSKDSASDVAFPGHRMAGRRGLEENRAKSGGTSVQA
jgi:hypothetical protein